MLKKLITIGHSKAIIIPHEFLDFYELQGKTVNQVYLEINDKITMTPIFEQRKVIHAT